LPDSAKFSNPAKFTTIGVRNRCVNAKQSGAKRYIKLRDYVDLTTSHKAFPTLFPAIAITMIVLSSNTELIFRTLIAVNFAGMNSHPALRNQPAAIKRYAP